MSDANRTNTAEVDIPTLPLLAPQPFEVAGSSYSAKNLQEASLEWKLRSWAFAGTVVGHIRDLFDLAKVSDEDLRDPHFFARADYDPMQYFKVELQNADPEWIVRKTAWLMCEAANSTLKASRLANHIKFAETTKDLLMAFNRYLLSRGNNPRFEENGLIHRTWAVRAIDALRVLRLRNVVIKGVEITDEVNKALDLLVARDEKVLDPAVFAASTAAWRTDDLVSIVEAVGPPVLAVLRGEPYSGSHFVDVKRGFGSLPDHLKSAYLTANDVSQLRDMVKDLKPGKSALSLVMLRDFALDLVIRISSETYSGVGSLRSAYFGGERDDGQHLANAKKGFRTQLKNVAVALVESASESGSANYKAKQFVACNDLNIVNAMAKEWAGILSQAEKKARIELIREARAIYVGQKQRTALSPSDGGDGTMAA